MQKQNRIYRTAKSISETAQLKKLENKKHLKQLKTLLFSQLKSQIRFAANETLFFYHCGVKLRLAKILLGFFGSISFYSLSSLLRFCFCDSHVLSFAESTKKVNAAVNL